MLFDLSGPPGPMANGNAGGAPPPPPPPPMGGLNSNSFDMSSLAAQLQQKKGNLKGKSNPQPAENSGSSTSSAGSGKCEQQTITSNGWMENN